jgi:hypothetical protein
VQASGINCSALLPAVSLYLSTAFSKLQKDCNNRSKDLVGKILQFFNEAGKFKWQNIML